MQVDRLRRRIAGAIERVVAAAVVDRQRRRRGVGREIEHRAGVAVEAVDSVAGSRRGRGAVHRSDRVDVRHLRRDHVAVRTPGIIRLREVRHDGILPGVVGIDRIGRIRRAAIVRPLVAKPERMSDFVDVGLVGVAVDASLAVVGATVGGNPVGADVDGLAADYAATGPEAAGIGLHRTVVGERDVRRTGGLHEADVGDFGPRLHRGLRQELFGRIQPGDVVGDGTGSPVMGRGAIVLPKAVDEVIGKRRDRGDRLGGGDHQSNRAAAGICQRKSITVISRHRGKRKCGPSRADPFGRRRPTGVTGGRCAELPAKTAHWTHPIFRYWPRNPAHRAAPFERGMLALAFRLCDRIRMP